LGLSSTGDVDLVQHIVHDVNPANGTEPSRIVTLLAGLQSALTLAVLVLPVQNIGLALRISLAAIIVFPLLVLWVTLRKDIETSFDEGKTD